MKNYAAGIILLFFVLSSNHIMAQRKACIMPDNGYWQLITHRRDPGSVTVRFYDLDSHLIYQEKMDLVPNWHNKRVCRVLAESLQTALAAYRQHHRTADHSGWVAGLLTTR